MREDEYWCIQDSSLPILPDVAHPHHTILHTHSRMVHLLSPHEPIRQPEQVLQISRHKVRKKKKKRKKA
ncbi:hypothetical protein BDZ91DRAFT_11435 [Kalaharituber pfeilii]|nr:hypothetical protein BDZ91DRAFT_11435 [Kalaharituber pfeilii]